MLAWTKLVPLQLNSPANFLLRLAETVLSTDVMRFRVFERSQLSNTLPFLLLTLTHTQTHRVILLSVVWLCELIVLRWKCQRAGVTLKHTSAQLKLENTHMNISVCPLSFNKNYHPLLYFGRFHRQIARTACLSWPCAAGKGIPWKLIFHGNIFAVITPEIPFVFDPLLSVTRVA